jgi:hypothetical protein
MEFLTGDTKVDYWSFIHNIGFASTLLLLTLLDLIINSYYGTIFAVTYWIAFFGINQILTMSYQYYIEHHATVQTTITIEDEIQHTICYLEEKEQFIVFQSLYDKFLHPKVAEHGSTIFLGHLYLSWIQAGTMVQMTEAEFYTFISDTEQQYAYQELDLWEKLIANTDSDIFESVLKQGRALNAIESKTHANTNPIHKF